MKPIHRVKLSVFADYHQFYVWDPELCDSHAPEEWTDQDVADRAKIETGVVVICPVRNMDVPVEVSIWACEPSVHFAEWQHVVVCPLSVSSGTIQVHECTGEALAEFSVAAGDYTLRCLFSGLDTLSENGLEGRDRYRVQIWPAHTPGLTVMKRWEEPT